MADPQLVLNREIEARRVLNTKATASSYSGSSSSPSRSAPPRRPPLRRVRLHIVGLAELLQMLGHGMHLLVGARRQERECEKNTLAFFVRYSEAAIMMPKLSHMETICVMLNCVGGAQHIGELW
jgi:hypothetical protein